MNQIVVWILISVSTGYYNSGNVSVVAHFANQEQCDVVRQNMPKGRKDYEASCVQAVIVKQGGV